ncbi:hypothetical protein QFC22_006159 [Naganishia vaughanmartiniae]|uniref:Uncharacterized protein n=1 Tax=Naganishia vaughanmartiniae TaxID=1424756 RepID=A0ACC2WMV5_9TREE|nr:hypothetical protein QFC22_006159 [Naganishia vaughanmartiniae]
MNQSSSSSPLTQLPSSSSSSSDNAQHHNAAAAAADSAPPPASSPSSASPALFGTSSSVFEMTNTNAPDLFHHERAGYHSTPVMAATKEQHDPTGMGISGGTMDTDTDTDMQIDMQLQQEKEDSPYPFAFAVPDLQPTSSANTSTSVNDPQERVALNIETQSIGYHAFIPPTNLHNNTNNVNGDSNGNVPTSTYAPAIASFYTPGHAASATSDAYLGMTALAGRGMVEQHAPRHQHQQEGRQYPHLEGLMQTFRQSQSMEHLSPNTPAPLPTVPFVPSMSSYTRAPAQNESPGHARFAGQGGLFVPSMVNDVRGYEELGAYDGGPAVHAASTMKHWSGQRVQQFGSQTPGYQHSQEHQLGHQQHTSVGLSHPMQQHSPALPQQRQNNGSPQGFSGPSFNPFVRPSTNDSSNSVGGYIVNEGQGQDGKYAVGTPMNGEYMRLAPPPTADSSGFDGGAVGDGRCYVPLDSHQRAFTGYGSQPPLQHQAHHQRQDSVDSLLLVHREMEELSTANTTPVFTPSTFPAFLPSTSVVYAPSRRSSRNRQEHRGMFNGEDVEMRESMGPTPSISTERGREETIGAGGYRSPSPKRGRRRGETKPGPNFLTKLYA